MVTFIYLTGFYVRSSRSSATTLYTFCALVFANNINFNGLCLVRDELTNWLHMRPQMGKIDGKKQFTGWYTQMVNKQTGNYLLFPVHTVESNTLRVGSQIFLVFAFSIADWECETGMGLLSKSTRALCYYILWRAILSHEYDGAE